MEDARRRSPGVLFLSSASLLIQHPIVHNLAKKSRRAGTWPLLGPARLKDTTKRSGPALPFFPLSVPLNWLGIPAAAAASFLPVPPGYRARRLIRACGELHGH